ncbi:hypothetical protein M6B22_07015 [Jatrophihabitans cynanchi]|uniref:DUF8175 domain-containing protein n=1 Tax=Jatrophihabitans cynanchi TaxID=2944128 RepID=A0ABY7K4F0_9ACTN|nr:hypothetical protein [Jatrophihabitans sp. SB3-54]WAX58507.1 hypothetical protein M6B22_07015 [Jatrophihabitans sp. SB3-54]
MSSYYDYDDASGQLHGSRLRIIATAAGVLIVLCLTFLVGYAAHGGAAAATKPGPTDAPTTASPSTGAPASAPTIPPTVQRGPLHRNSAAVIAGYSHDQQGAVAAAGNYTTALYVQTNRTHAQELTVLSSIATSPADAARMAGDFSSEDAALAKLLDVANLQTPGVIAYGHPIGYRVESASSTAATIDVYVVGGQGVADAPSDSAGAGETFYEVDQVELVWQSADWRMRNWSHLVQNNGPELATVAGQGYLPFPIGQTDPAGTGS